MGLATDNPHLVGAAAGDLLRGGLQSGAGGSGGARSATNGSTVGRARNGAVDLASAWRHRDALSFDPEVYAGVRDPVTLDWHLAKHPPDLARIKG